MLRKTERKTLGNIPMGCNISLQTLLDIKNNSTKTNRGKNKSDRESLSFTHPSTYIYLLRYTLFPLLFLNRKLIANNY